MLNTFGLLMQSRKFWVGTLTMLAIIAATVGMAAGKIPPAGFVPFVASVTTIGLGTIGSIAWEDSAKKSAAPPAVVGELLSQPATPVVTMNVTPGAHSPSDIAEAVKAVTTAMKDGAS